MVRPASDTDALELPKARTCPTLRRPVQNKNASPEYPKRRFVEGNLFRLALPAQTLRTEQQTDAHQHKGRRLGNQHRYGAGAEQFRQIPSAVHARGLSCAINDQLRNRVGTVVIQIYGITG